ncbi:MAG: AAA family ATPase [Azospirillaceae bacterium]
MITKIRVDGFRSLSEFELDINPGLNILVGPNGAGKTNIVTFFEFLSLLMTDSLSMAVAKLGGAGSVFRKIKKDQFVDTIKISISGKRKAHVSRGSSSQLLFYQYSCSVSLSESRDAVYFSDQNFKVHSARRNQTRLLRLENDDYRDLDIGVHYQISNSDDEDNNYKIEIKKYDSKRLPPTMFFHSKDLKNIDMEDLIRVDVAGSRSSDLSLASHLSWTFDFVREIIDDIASGQAFNILPESVRKAEDSTRLPGISKDGSGLAATLYALDQAQKQSSSSARRKHRSAMFRSMPRRLRYYSMQFKASYSEVRDLTRLIYPALKDIKVNSDTFNSRLYVTLEIDSGNNSSIEVPLNSVSDGTVKWMSLIAAILTNRTVFSIEEPENFIHPLMQQELLTIMREDSEKNKKEKFILMTTHSETLLNSADPSEIIFVQFESGHTTAHRIKNPSHLRNEIRNSGFGLGHYYVTGVAKDV